MRASDVPRATEPSLSTALRLRLSHRRKSTRRHWPRASLRRMQQPSQPQRPAGLSCLTSCGRQAAAFFPRRVGCPTAGGSQSNGAHALTARCTLLRPRQSSTILFLLTLKTFCDTHVLGLRRWRRGAPRARPLRELITRHPQYLKAPERYQGRTILLCKDGRRCSGWCASCRP
jgi:hypothetical protein